MEAVWPGGTRSKAGVMVCRQGRGEEGPLGDRKGRKGRSKLMVTSDHFGKSLP